MSDPPINKVLQKINFLYRISGLTVEDRKKTKLEAAKYLFHFIWIGTDIVLAIDWFIEGALKGLDFMELTYVMPLFSLGLMGELKAFFHVFYEKNIRLLLRNIRYLETRKLMDNPFDEEMVRGETKFLSVLMNVLLIMNVILLLMFNLGPLVLITVKYFITGEVELLLPFLDVYPFNAFDLRYWPFAYTHEVWTACIVIINIFAVDFLFYICCTHIRIQFKLLKRELENLIPKNENVTCDDIRAKLRDLIGWHQEVISCANMLEAIYAKSTLFNYLLSSLVICLTGFNVTAIKNLAIVLTFAVVAVVGMLQIFFICFFGDILFRSSIEVSDAVYNCRWYLTDASIRKITLMIQTRAQKPCKITAAGYADVNLKAFMRILSTSWSYFALLQTVYRSL